MSRYMNWFAVTSFLLAVGSARGEVIEVKVTGGHETKRVDRGRPVVLVAAGLGVPEQVFRDAFSHVNPSPMGEAPGAQRVHDNKAALLQHLGPYGITNDRLDTVSDYYRYRPGMGDIWKHRDAKVLVTIEKGAVVKVEIKDGGAGYTSAPTLAIPGYPDIKLAATLSFSTRLDRNGSISKIAQLP